MFLRNWYKAIGQVMASMSAKTTYVTTSGSEFSLNNAIDNTVVQLGYPSDNYFAPAMKKVRTAISTYGGVIFGSGTIPPTIDDYNLSGSLLTTITASVNYNFTTDDSGVCYEAVYTITNTGASEITIGEIGLLAGGDSAPNKKFLVERTVLDNPVTIPAGGIGQVTYTIRMNYPTA